MKSLILLISILSLFISSNLFSDFKEAQQFYTEKKFTSAIQYGLDGVQVSISNIINTTLSSLPCLSKTSMTNVNFNIDLYNQPSFFYFDIAYHIIYKKYPITIQLEYAFESVSYYKTYIKESQSYIPKEASYRLITLPDQKKLLWYPQELTAYYVYSFKESNGINNMIPGVLLKISFSKNITEQLRDNIIEEIITKISWKKLQDILS